MATGTKNSTAEFFKPGAFQRDGENNSGVQRLNFVRVGVGREGAGGVAAGGQARNAGVAGATDRRANYTNNHTR
jgi:hypothetical protein